MLGEISKIAHAKASVEPHVILCGWSKVREVVGCGSRERSWIQIMIVYNKLYELYYV